jgi:hypothetical protein
VVLIYCVISTKKIAGSYGLWERCNNKQQLKNPSNATRLRARLGQRSRRINATRLRARLGQRSRRLNAKRRNNRAKRFASDARSPIAPNAKRGGLNCAGENQRSDILSALAYKRSASGARCPKQSLRQASAAAKYGKSTRLVVISWVIVWQMT